MSSQQAGGPLFLSFSQQPGRHSSVQFSVSWLALRPKTSAPVASDMATMVTKILFFITLAYLLQHADPSAGWAQQAPPLSSLLALGVQQGPSLLVAAQHAGAVLLSLAGVALGSGGMFPVFIRLCFNTTL